MRRSLPLRPLLFSLVFTLLALPCLGAQRQGTTVPFGTANGQLVVWSTSANGGLGGYILNPLLGYQAANTFLAGPGSGGTGTPGFRQIVGADLPLIGTAGNYAYPTALTTDATGRVTAVTAGNAPVIYTAGRAISISGGVISTTAPSKYAATLGAVTAGTPIVLTHGLGTADCVWNVVVVSSGQSVYPTVAIDATHITITFSASYPAGTYRVIVEG